MTWFRQWLDASTGDRPVTLGGFSSGAAFAAGLLLAVPERCSGAAVLYGTLPFDAGVPVSPGRVAGVPVFVAQGDADPVIPRQLLERTWDYLHGESGAVVTSRCDSSGHGITAASMRGLGSWLKGASGSNLD